MLNYHILMHMSLKIVFILVESVDRSVIMFT